MKKISIIIPAYNEEKTINAIIDKVKKVELTLEKEIIVVEDASQDSTLKLLKEIKDIKLIIHEKNKGKGAAIRTGLEQSTGDIIMIQDADLEYNPEQYPILIKSILDYETKVVYGSRFLTTDAKKMHWSNYLGNRFLTIVTNTLFRCNITDMETCYKVLTREVLNSITLKANKFDFEPEITAKICKAGFRIKEVPISFDPRNFKEGKKDKLDRWS